MIEYSYKEICVECLILGHADCYITSLCDICNGVGQTESTSVELPYGAYDIVKEQE